MSKQEAERLAVEAAALLRQWPDGKPVAWYYVEDPWGANEWHFMLDSPESQNCDPRDWTALYAAPPDSAASIAKLERQRDALLEALQGLMDPATNEDGEWYKETRAKARAAIKAAGGGK